LILLTFGTEFVHATAEVPHKFKIKGSKVKVTACGNDGKNLLNY